MVDIQRRIDSCQRPPSDYPTDRLSVADISRIYKRGAIVCRYSGAAVHSSSSRMVIKVTGHIVRPTESPSVTGSQIVIIIPYLLNCLVKKKGES